MFPWAAPDQLPQEKQYSNCPTVWGDDAGGYEDSADVIDFEKQRYGRSYGRPAIVLSRFRQKERRSYRNLVMRSKRVVEVLGGDYLGVSHDLRIIKERNTPGDIAVGACRFGAAEKGGGWMDSDPNFMGNDLLNHTHEAWLISLDEADATKDGKNIWYLSNVMCSAASAHKAMPAVDKYKLELQKYSGRMVANNNFGLRVRGSSSRPQYIILIQFTSMAKFYEWDQSPEGQQLESEMNRLGDRESLLFAVCPDFPSNAESKRSSDELRNYIKRHGAAE